jgi:hypothetical protein
MKSFLVRGVSGGVLFLALAFGPARAADSLNWNTLRNRVSADITAGTVTNVLERIATATHWQVFCEPGSVQTVSAKFANLAPGEALRLLLGDLNYALLPGTNFTSKLYVFRTDRQNATQLVSPKPRGSRVVPNELIVRLKPGANIDDVAKLLGAQVVGRISGLNAYRLQFDSEAAANAGREKLANNPDIAAIDNNYFTDRVQGPESLPNKSSSLQLQLKPPPSNGRVVIGLIDTAVQPLGNGLDQFLLKQLSVAGDVSLPADTLTHGTAMAETMLRSLQGMTQGSTSVQILPVNVYPGGGVGDASTTTFDVANGIMAAVNGGATIINLSLGSPEPSPFLEQVVQQVGKLNIPMFAAAGNEPVATPFYPAAYPGVNAVTAIDQGQLAPYASRGSFVSLAAPGTAIVPFGSQAFAVEGTSVSSAFTAGVAAGYLESAGSNPSKLQNFLNNNFGVKITSGK